MRLIIEREEKNGGKRRKKEDVNQEKLLVVHHIFLSHYFSFFLIIFPYEIIHMIFHMKGGLSSMSKGHRTKIKRERNEVKDTRPKAHGKYLRISDIKARIVLEQIKGRSIKEASAILEYSPRYAAYLIRKVLMSAVANAEHNMNLDADDLYVEDAIANRGKTYGSRFRLSPRAKGRGYRIERKVSNISIILNKK